MDTKITPKEVKEWYRTSGLAPAFGVWLNLRQQKACPLFARFAAANPDVWNLTVAEQEQAAEQDARRVYGSDYVRGFVRGWDATGCPTLYDGYSPEYVQGCKEGGRVAVEILGGRDEDGV
jgi:hypothetical protein